MEHRGGQLGHLNGPMAVSLPLGDMPMEALDAALAGLDGDPHHELALDQAAMDLHDNDEVCHLLFIRSPALRKLAAKAISAGCMRLSI